MKIKDSELKNILAEVEAELVGILKDTSADLRKAAGEDDGGSDEGGSEGGEGSAPASEGASEGGGEAPVAATAPESSAPAEGSAAPEASAPAPDAAMGDPAMDAGPVDPEALKAEYAKLAPEELKMHYLAAKAALFEAMGAADAAGPEAAAGAPGMAPDAAGSAAPAPTPAPMAPAPAGPAAGPMDPMADPTMKAEVPADMKNNPANGGTQRAAVPDAIKAGVKKSETDLVLEDLKKSDSEKSDKIKELETMVEGLAKALDLVVGQPMRKAATRISDVQFVPKTPEAAKSLSKSEIETRLVNLVKAGKLDANQRERVISFSMGHASAEQIQDLLEIK